MRIPPTCVAVFIHHRTLQEELRLKNLFYWRSTQKAGLRRRIYGFSSRAMGIRTTPFSRVPTFCASGWLYFLGEGASIQGSLSGLRARLALNDILYMALIFNAAIYSMHSLYRTPLPSPRCLMMPAIMAASRSPAAQQQLLTAFARMQQVRSSIVFAARRRIR